MRRALDEGSFHDRIPPTGAVLIDALGHVWVSHYYFLGSNPTKWEVFDEAGIWLGTVSTPSELRVLRIGSDRVLGVGKDDLGVSYIRVHALDRR